MDEREDVTSLVRHTTTLPAEHRCDANVSVDVMLPITFGTVAWVKTECKPHTHQRWQQDSNLRKSCLF